MKIIAIIFVFMIPILSFGQEVVELEVKFSLKDSVLTIKLLDQKYKQIKVVEKQFGALGEIELIRNYDFEGDVVHDHMLFTKNGNIMIEVISGNKKKEFQLLRAIKSNK